MTRQPADDTESALIIVCPQAEGAVALQRRRYDRAAQFGVPAHVTVTYPFKPPMDLTNRDQATLEDLFSACGAFTVTANRTDWFDDRVVFVALDDNSRVRSLTGAVTTDFPDFPPYRGVYDEVVPHLTIGHDQPLNVLQDAERDVQTRLPIVQEVDHIELWKGPALGGAMVPDSWRRTQTYRLG